MLVQLSGVLGYPQGGGQVLEEGAILGVMGRRVGVWGLLDIKILRAVAAVAHKRAWPQGIAVLEEGRLLVVVPAGMQAGGNARRAKARTARKDEAAQRSECRRIFGAARDAGALTPAVVRAVPQMIRRDSRRRAAFHRRRAGQLADKTAAGRERQAAEQQTTQSSRRVGDAEGMWLCAAACMGIWANGTGGLPRTDQLSSPRARQGRSF